MNTLIHADIFFFVTTIAVVIVALAVAVVLFYSIKILKNVREISEAIKDETNLIREDIQAARENVRREGFKLKHLASFFSGFPNKKTRSKKQK
jgi:uncharacterized protein YoxC